MSGTRFHLSNGSVFTTDVTIDVFREKMSAPMVAHHHINITTPGHPDVTIFVRHIVTMEEIK